MFKKHTQLFKTLPQQCNTSRGYDAGQQLLLVEQGQAQRSKG